MKQLTKLATALPTGFLSSFLLTTFVVTAFIVTLLLTTHFGSVVTAQEAPQVQAQGEERIAFTMRHTTSWFGDTADAAAGAWVQGTINAMWVDEDGTVYTNSIWDEDSREAGVYRDGQVVGRLPDLHGTGGYAVTGDDAHIYVAATLDGRYAVRRFNKSDYNASPFAGGEGPSGDGLIVSERGHIRGLAYHDGELFASDTEGDRIRVYDAATMTHKRDLPSSRPGPLSVSEEGSLWVVEEVIDREISEDGTLTVSGAGSDIWDNADGFYYLYRQVTGDTVLSARVARQENTHEWAKAGVMVRETLDPGSPHAVMALTPGNGSTLIWRAAAGEGSQSSTPGDGARAPYWVRLERRGDTLSGYVSEDGSEGSWSEVGEATLGLAEEVYLGLAVSSHNEGALSSVEFDNVGDLASWQGQDIGNARDGGAFSGRVTSTTTTRTIRKLTLDGELQDVQITDVVNPAALAVDNEGRLLVAEDGPRQQILIYDVSGAPELVGTLGEEGGIYAAEPGRYGDLKLNGPVGVGVDAEGNIYVGSSGLGNRDKGGQDLSSGEVTDIRKFSPEGALGWKILGLIFVDTAVADPEDPSQLYTSFERYTVDYAQDEPGQEWRGTYAARTVDRFTYPNDPRFNLPDFQQATPIGLRHIGGETFLYVTGMYADYLGVYRFDGDIAVPAVLMANYPLGWPEERPSRGAWIWRDENGDGDFQEEEFTATNENDGKSWGWQVDGNGDIWQAFEGKVRHLPLQGLNDVGNPIYDHAAGTDVEAPTPFNHLRRAHYLPETDTMYLSGYTPEHPYAGEFKESGDVVVRFEGWLAGNREPHWTLVLNPAGSDNPTGLAVAGERLFISYVRSARVEVYNTETTVQEGMLRPGPEVARYSSWHDVPYPIQAFQLTNGESGGEYIVLAEENARGRILMYRHMTPTIGLTTGAYTTDDNSVLPLAITNSLEMDATLTELAWQSGEQGGTEAHTLAIPARTEENTTLSLEGVAPWSTFSVDVTATFEDADAVTTNARLTTDSNPLLRDPLGPGGLAAEDIAAAMAGVPSIDLAASGTVMMEGDVYGGAEDLSGDVWLTWDDEHLYLSAKIEDDVHHQTYTGIDIWQGDSVQFVAAPDKVTNRSYQFGLAGTPEGTQVYRWISYQNERDEMLIEDAQAEVSREGTTTTYRLALPWDALAPIRPEDGSFAFSMLVNDNDGSGRKGWIEWGGGISYWNNPAEFHPVQFADETAGTD